MSHATNTGGSAHSEKAPAQERADEFGGEDERFFVLRFLSVLLSKQGNKNQANRRISNVSGVRYDDGAYVSSHSVAVHLGAA